MPDRDKQLLFSEFEDLSASFRSLYKSVFEQSFSQQGERPREDGGAQRQTSSIAPSSGNAFPPAGFSLRLFKGFAEKLAFVFVYSFDQAARGGRASFAIQKQSSFLNISSQDVKRNVTAFVFTAHSESCAPSFLLDCGVFFLGCFLARGGRVPVSSQEVLASAQQICWI